MNIKIKSVKTHLLRVKLSEKESFSYSQAWYRDRETTIVEISCSDGTVGWGEAFGNPWINDSIIHNIYAPAIIGRNPFDIHPIWLDLYNRFRDHGQKGAVVEALSAIDIALWDICARLNNLSISQYTGRRYNNILRPYATGFYRRKLKEETEDLKKEAYSYSEAGFNGMKIKVGYGIDYDAEVIYGIRDVTGSGISLMIDANHAYNVTDAVQLCHKIEDICIDWFEEPIIPEDKNGYKELRKKTSIPIAGGETEFTHYGFQPVIEDRCMDIIQPDICATGGFTEIMKIVDMAEVAQLNIIPHVWGSGIGLAASLQFAAMIPPIPPALVKNPPWFEYDRTPNSLREELIEPQIVMKDGQIEILNDPGLGITVNREIIQKFKIGGHVTE